MTAQSEHVHETDWSCCTDLVRPAVSVTDEEQAAADARRALDVARVRAWGVALDKVTRPNAVKVSGQYDKGLITLAEFIAELAEVHFKGSCVLIESGEWTDLTGDEHL